MAATSVSYTGNGSNRDFSIPFSYIDSTHLQATINGSVTSAWTLFNATTLRFNSAPSNGAAIVISRVTPVNAPLAVYQAGSAIRAGDLTKNTNQALYACEETQNAAAQASSDASSAITTVNSLASSFAAYIPVANLAALGALSPVNLNYYELTDSTGVQGSSLVQGVPGGFVGASTLTVRLQYRSAPTNKFVWLGYFANDPQAQYAVKATETTASNAQTTANAALARSGGTMTGNITFNGSQTFPVSGIQDASTSVKGVVQLSTATNSTAVNLAATPSAVKTVADTTTNIDSRLTVVEGIYSNRNMISNGDFVYNQINGTASSTPAGTSPLVVDRWRLDSSVGGLLTVQTFTTGGPNNWNPTYQRITTAGTRSLVSTDYFSIVQAVEGIRMARLLYGSVSALTSTLSFWIRSNVTGTFSISIQNSTKSHSYVSTFTINSGSTWEFKQFTIAPGTLGTWDAFTDVGARVRICFAAGSTYQASSLDTWGAGDRYGHSTSTNYMSGVGRNLDITNVQWEAGSTLTNFEKKPLYRTQAECYRFYYDYKGPIQYNFNASAGGNQATYPITYPTAMRIAPTVTRNGGTLTNATAALATSSPTGTMLVLTSAASGLAVLALNSSESISANAEFTA